MKKLTAYLNKNKEILYILIFAVFSAITFELFNRPFGTVTNIKIDFDDKIPFIKELILVYHTFMPLIVYTGFILYRDNKENYRKYVAALFLSQITAYVIYILFQTEVPRYNINLLGEDIFSNLVKLTYTLDNNYSGAPSLHVCHTLLASIYLHKSGIERKYVIPLILYLMLVGATTVLVKQHVVLDIPAGIVHAVVNCLMVGLIFRNKNN